MKEAIAKEVAQELIPSFLAVIDNSHLHAGHIGNTKKGNSHFKARICSEKFNELSLVKRHQLVNKICKPFFDQGMHALEIEALTKNEWRKKYG